MAANLQELDLPLPAEACKHSTFLPQLNLSAKPSHAQAFKNRAHAEDIWLIFLQYGDKSSGKQGH